MIRIMFRLCLLCGWTFNGKWQYIFIYFFGVANEPLPNFWFILRIQLIYGGWRLMTFISLLFHWISSRISSLYLINSFGTLVEHANRLFAHRWNAFEINESNHSFIWCNFDWTNVRMLFQLRRNIVFQRTWKNCEKYIEKVRRSTNVIIHVQNI